MRKITPVPIAQFAAITTAELAAAYTTNSVMIVPWVSADFRGLTIVFGTVLLFYLLAIAIFRLLQSIAPVPTGDIPQGSRGERRAFLYTLHYIMLFNPLIFSRAIPFPLMRLLLRALGARMGANAYCAGLMMDPQFVSVGDDSIIGNSAMIIPHVIEGDKLGFYPVRIGSRVTIGAGAVVLSDVVVGDDATVAIHSVVAKGTRIPDGEIWGGIPARRLGSSGKSSTVGPGQGL